MSRPLRVIAPCGCEGLITTGGVMVPVLCFWNWEHWNATRAWRAQVGADPARAYDLARAGYAMAAQGVGRAKGGG